MQRLGRAVLERRRAYMQTACWLSQTRSVVGNYIAALELFKKAEAENLLSDKAQHYILELRGHDRS